MNRVAFRAVQNSQSERCSDKNTNIYCIVQLTCTSTYPDLLIFHHTPLHVSNAWRRMMSNRRRTKNSRWRPVTCHKPQAPRQKLKEYSLYSLAMPRGDDLLTNFCFFFSFSARNIVTVHCICCTPFPSVLFMGASDEHLYGVVR